MQTVLIVIHVFLSIGLIGMVLIQHGKGADMGAAFGSGASSTVFGSRGASNFLSRSTGILAAAFFLTSLALAYFAMQQSEPVTLMGAGAPAAVEQSVVPQASSDLPVVPADPADAAMPKVAE